MKMKRNAFAALGWGVWKAAALIGIPYAKKRVREGGQQRDVTDEIRKDRSD